MRYGSEQELEDKRRQEETLIADMPGGIAIYRLKKDGRVATEYVSESLAKMCGYTASEFLEYLREDSRVNLVSEDLPSVMESVQKSLKDGQPVSVTYHIYTKKQEILFIRLDANVMPMESVAADEIAVLYAVHTIVSDESKQIIEKQQQLQELIDKVPTGIGIYEVTDGKLAQNYMNDAFYRMLGTNRENRKEYFGENALMAAHPDDRKFIQAALDKLLAGSQSANISYRLKHADGNWFWVHLEASVVERRDRYLKLYAVFSDYNTIKQAEQTQEEHKITLNVAMRAAKVLVWKYDYRFARITDTLTLGESYHLPKVVENIPQSLIDMGFISEESIPEFRHFFTQVSEERAVTVDIKAIVDEQGGYIWYRIIDTPIYDADGNFIGSIGTGMDITEQKEREIHYEEQLRLKRIAMKDAVFTVSFNLSQNKITSFESQPSQFVELSECKNVDELLQGLKSVVINQKEWEKFSKVADAKTMMGTFKKGNTHIEIVTRLKENTRWVRVTYDMIENPYTKNIEAVSAIYDVTASVRMERVIAQLLAVDYQSILLIDTKTGETIPYQNSTQDNTLTEIFAFQKKAKNKTEGLEEFFRAYAVPGTAEEIIKKNSVEYIHHVLETEPFYENIYSLRMDGRLEHFRILYCYLDGDETILLSAAQNVTEIYDRELRQRSELTLALETAEKANQAKTDFLSRVSHDMRTPLNGILGLTTLLREKATDAEQIQDLQQLQMSGDYLLNLINDTLDVSKIESGKLELNPIVCEGRSVFDNVLSLIKPNLLEKQIELKINAENLPFTNLYIDVGRVEQIVMNILGNAIKFTPKGGMIAFTMENVSCDEEKIVDRITIRDNGIGMSQEFLPHMFEPFSQEENGRTSSYQGTGLGMAITKHIIEVMGGEIQVDSVVGKGTTFCFTLPMKIATKEQLDEWTQTKESAVSENPLEGKRVLLCEDHPLNATIAIRLLEKKGLVVEHAKNGKIGVEMFENSSPEYYDIILMDIRMPVMDGIEATQIIRSLAREDARAIPIVAMTANAFEEDIRLSREAGMDAHLGKPIQIEKLFKTMKEVMQL